MNIKHDVLFDALSNLKWYPWIGKNYAQKGILLLGESHYEDGHEWQEGNKNTTRMITEKRYRDEQGKWTLHNNVEKTLLNKDLVSLEERRELWDSVVYWNLVQRLLGSRGKDDRPTDNDFDEGWKLFFNVIEIFKPEHVIVLGKASYGRLGYYLQNVEENWKKQELLSNSNEKIFSLKNGDRSLKIIFINHPSGSFGFNYKKWSKLIQEEVINENTDKVLTP